MAKNVKFISIATVFIKYAKSKDDLWEYKCLYCNKNYQQKFEEKLNERFFNTFKFSNHDSSNFIYYYEKLYILMDIWMIGNETLLLEKDIL